MATKQTENDNINTKRQLDESENDVSTSSSQTRSDMTFKPKNVSKFMARLRDLGMEANYLIRRAIREEGAGKKQYLIAMLVSLEEISNDDYTGVEEFRRYLLNCNYSETFHAEGRYVLQDRTVVLLNSPWKGKHGEARLLDPYCKILPNIVERREFKPSDTDLLSVTEEKFYEKFGPVRRILLLFSFYIPCTIPDHHCAKLVGEFAERNNETIIVSYQTVHHDTDQKKAYEFMKSDKINVIVISSKSVRIAVNNEIKQFHSVDLQSPVDEYIIFEEFEDPDALKRIERKEKIKRKSIEEPKTEHVTRKKKRE